ncbi:uncharacterized protein PV07_12510 [Cladophialophora immunda]|uniref:Cyclohexanone monooxygenase n=1 Tax=Cladophialophora immunda TaxID=569365 RepID=A0A0D2BSS3_9EURO|nr:uncharacterized protein PV07_12510 [Cladophialophora immunda]KIW22093.1 hypothetical protein PV07_12510 [Cladophialophora immunda]
MAIGSTSANGHVGETDVVVVGAGFSGLYMIYSLNKLGFRVRGFEAADDVGGTWWWNRYPGARCDSESLTYCYTFDEELCQEWTWTERYPSGGEVLSYLSHAADRFDLRRHFQFKTKVTTAVYDEKTRRWTITTGTGDSVSARFFVSAVGNLSVPATPAVPGIDKFEGRWVHTGRWPAEPIDFTGLRIAVIGTGSSGIQIIQEIAKTAAHLTVFQRTPTFTIPLRNQPLDPDVQRLWKANYPELIKVTRYSPGGLPFYVGTKSLKEATPEEQRKGLQAGWNLGGFRFMFGTFNDIGSDHEANKVAADFVREQIDAIVKDPDTAALLKPTSYPIGAKRVPLETNYYQVYNQENVKLVDLRASPIRQMTTKGLTAGDTEYEFDLVVFATGFEAITGPMLQIDVTGRGGQKLKDVWKDGPYSYLGLATPGFPNLITLAGPGGPGVISNVPPTLEQHVDWVAECLTYLRTHKVDEIEARGDATDAWISHVHSEAQKTMYPYAPSSWYDGSNLTGQVRPFPVYTGGFGHYRRICDAITADNYHGFLLHQEDTDEVNDTRKAHPADWYRNFLPTSAGPAATR